MRQRDDLLFAETLRNLVAGTLNQQQKDLLQKRIVRPEDVPENVLHLFRNNEAVDKFNREILAKMITEGATSEAKDTCQGDASESVKKNFEDFVQGLSTKDTCGLPRSLQFKVGARYMMTVNIDTADGLVNGATGTLKKIEKSAGDQPKPLRVWIEFDDQKVGFRLRERNRVSARNLNVPDLWTPVEPTGRIVRRQQSGGSLQLMRRQFPLVPAMAVTIHKSQGDTYSQVAVHLTTGMQRSHLYVACSRAKTAEGLYLVGNLKLPGPPKSTDKVTAEMRRLRRDRPILPSLTFLDDLQDDKLKIVMHNVRSLRAHYGATCNDSSLMAADVLGFVETKASVVGETGFDGFSCVFERICPPYGTSIYVRTGVEAEVVNSIAMKNKDSTTYIVEVSTLCTKQKGETTYVTFVYKSPKAPRQVLEEALSEASQNIPQGVCQVFIGDFNIERSKPEGDKLLVFMRSMGLQPILPADCITTNEGSHIDQCFSNAENATAGTGESLTSDHKPIWIVL